MLNVCSVEVITKILECILQSRMDAKKKTFQRFENALKNLDKTQEKPFADNLLSFLTEILASEQYGVRGKVSSFAHSMKKQSSLMVSVFFTLTEKKTGKIIQAETFLLTVRPKQQLNDESFLLITEFFRQIILFLNKRPLFATYQKDKQLKSRFILNFKVTYQVRDRSIVDNKTSSSSVNDNHNVLDYGALEVILRQNNQIYIYLQIYFLPSIVHLKNPAFMDEQKPRKESFNLSYPDNQRKFSVYAYYDPDLDFTFLSSDDESLKKKSILEPEQIQIDATSEEFELLMYNEDEEFLENNKDLFEGLAELQKNYFASRN